MTEFYSHRRPLKVNNRSCIKIERRVLRSFFHQVKPLITIVYPLFVFNRIFIKEQLEKINIVFQEKRDQVITVLSFLYIKQALAFLQAKLNNFPVCLLAGTIEVENLLSNGGGRK